MASSSSRRNTSPNEEYARNMSSDGELPLHKACRDKKLDTALQLLKEYPGAVAVANAGGRTPLHIACYTNVNSGALQEFLKAIPDRSALTLSDKYGRTPLYDLWYGRSPTIIGFERSLKKVETLDDLDAPTSLLWKKTLLIVDAFYDRHHNEKDDSGRGMLTTLFHFRHRQKKRRLAALFHLRQRPRKGASHQGRSPILHALFHLGCPDCVYQMATMLLRHELEIVDDDGIYPCVLAATTEGASLDTLFMTLRYAPALCRIDQP